MIPIFGKDKYGKKRKADICEIVNAIFYDYDKQYIPILKAASVKAYRKILTLLLLNYK